jgi:L-arabinonolactonase
MVVGVQIQQAAGPATLGECPIWSESEQVLYWVDIDGRAVHKFDPATGVDEARATPGRPGCITLTDTNGLLLMATEHMAMWFDWPTGTMTPLAQLEPAGTGNRLNDGRTDPEGRFVVGSMYEDTKAGKRSGILHQIEADGTSSEIRTDIGVTNGIAFDTSRSRAYFADTSTSKILAWDYDRETGRRFNERVFFDYAGHPGRPDGGCVDAEGFYWSASVHGWAVIRIHPDGTLDRRIELPVEMPTMPAFGGSDLSTLYVTSISAGSQPGRDGFDPGALLAIDAGVAGVVDAPFAGTML